MIKNITKLFNFQIYCILQFFNINAPILHNQFCPSYFGSKIIAKTNCLNMHTILINPYLLHTRYYISSKKPVSNKRQINPVLRSLIGDKMLFLINEPANSNPAQSNLDNLSDIEKSKVLKVNELQVETSVQLEGSVELEKSVDLISYPADHSVDKAINKKGNKKRSKNKTQQMAEANNLDIGKEDNNTEDNNKTTQIFQKTSNQINENIHDADSKNYANKNSHEIASAEVKKEDSSQKVDLHENNDTLKKELPRNLLNPVTFCDDEMFLRLKFLIKHRGVSANGEERQYYNPVDPEQRAKNLEFLKTLRKKSNNSPK